MSRVRYVLSSSLLLVTAACLPTLALGQAASYPSKPIRMIIGYPPGSGVDLIPRMVGERLLVKWGQPMLVENRPGASGHIATEAAAKAPPDGYTLLTVPPAFATTPAMFDSLPFDADAMVPVTVMVLQANALVVNVARNGALQTVRQLVDQAKANPDKLNYGSSGNGGSHHLSMELLKMLTGVRMQHVPYKGVALVNGLLGGEVDTGFFTLGGLLPHIKAGKLRALAVGGSRRHAALPDVPTLSEALPGMASATWFAMIAPAKTPADVVAKLNGAVVEALRHPDVQKRLADLDAETVANSPAEAAAFIKEEKERWGKVIRTAGIKPD
jgi:tripartite-type tricarboxylate transporter receptor subunit TctC